MEPNATELDLRRHVLLGCRHMLNTLDERRGYLPFFHYELVQPPVCIKHGPFDSPHVVGRYLDALTRSVAFVDLPQTDEVYGALAGFLYESLAQHPSGLAWNTPGAWQPDVAVLHNCREMMYGLLALWHGRGDERAAVAARGFCRSILNVLGNGNRFGGECLGRQGWTTAFSGILAPPPATSGRFIRPLLAYYRLTQDDIAFDLLQRFVADNLAIAFTEDGQITEGAGSHVHSITSSLTGLIEWALYTGDRPLLARLRRVYDEGLAGLRSSYGWVKEFRFALAPPGSLDGAGYPAHDIPRGEANNTGDLIEAALLLGAAGWPAYYEDAECMARNHLLVSQILDASWVEETTELADSEEVRFGDVSWRVEGGFCFGSPNGLISYKAEPYQVNADLAGGAVQAICELWDAIWHKEGEGIRIDLYFTKASEQLALQVPTWGGGPITAELRRPAQLSFRMPPWSPRDQVRYQVGHGDAQLGEPHISDGYLTLPALPAGSRVQVWLGEHQKSAVELISGHLYRIEWRNNRVTTIDPPGEGLSLYRTDR